MKKIILIVAASLLMSCASMMQQYSQDCYVYDFSRYTEQGFIITPTSTGFNYEPIGEISMEFTAGYKKGQPIADKPAIRQHASINDDIYASTPRPKDKKGGWFDPTPEYCLDEFVKHAKGVGAHGILNFKAQANYATYASKGTVTRKLTGYTISGFAVKIAK